jgi:hypothetical protein
MLGRAYGLALPVSIGRIALGSLVAGPLMAVAVAVAAVVQAP